MDDVMDNINEYRNKFLKIRVMNSILKTSNQFLKLPIDNEGNQWPLQKKFRKLDQNLEK